MEKENVVKKILSKALVGFPIGVTLLIIAYASIYFIVGEDVFNAELYQIHNINTLLSQIVSVGISGYMLSTSFYIISIYQNKELDNIWFPKHPYKAVFATLIYPMCIFFIIVPTIGNTRIFSQNIRTLNLLISVIVLALSFLVFGIKSAREQHWIKEINKMIKEKNNKQVK